MDLNNPFTKAEFEPRRNKYVGKVVEMVSMEDDPHPIEAGDYGEVVAVDDFGQLIVRWQSGRSLNVNLEAGDEVKIISNNKMEP